MNRRQLILSSIMAPFLKRFRAPQKKTFQFTHQEYSLGFKVTDEMNLDGAKAFSENIKREVESIFLKEFNKKTNENS